MRTDGNATGLVQHVSSLLSPFLPFSRHKTFFSHELRIANCAGLLPRNNENRLAAVGKKTFLILKFRLEKLRKRLKAR